MVGIFFVSMSISELASEKWWSFLLTLKDKNMINSIGRIAGHACTSAGKQLSKTACFVAGAVAGAGITVLIVKKGGEIWDKLPAVFDPKSSKAFSPDDSSCKSQPSEGNGCHTVYTTVYVNQTNVTNTTNITINPADSSHKEDVRFSENNHTETSRESSSEDTVTASGSSVSQDSETVSPQSSGNPVSGEIFSGKEESCESSIPFPDDFPFPFYLSLSDDCIKELFDGMHGKYFHKRTSLEQFTYVLTGRGEKPKSGIPIEWIASSRCFALFIGVVCAPYYEKWDTAKPLFYGRINRNLSSDFSRMVKHDLVKGARISPTFSNNTYFKKERDANLKSLFVFLSGFSFF